MAFALASANKQGIVQQQANGHNGRSSITEPSDAAGMLDNGPPRPRLKKMASRLERKSDRPTTLKEWPRYLYTMLAYYCNVVVMSNYFQHSITGVILIASALVGIQTYPSMDGKPALVILDSIVLYIFTIECVIKLVACGYKPWEYLWYKGAVQFWNLFDFLVVVVCYLPLKAGMVTVIRLFRLLRVLKLVKALPELQVLVMGLLGSLSSIFYVALLLMLVFYLYGIMCVSFFRENDPVHFGQLEVAFLTLFRMATFEDWTDVMYTQLYGCDVYPYHFRTQWCTSPNRAMGWAAAPFFVSFIVLSSLVVLNLFIGVIISNMNEARANLEKEANQPPPADVGDEFAQDAQILRSMLSRMEQMSGSLAEARDSMTEMQSEVEKLEDSARVRKNKFRNGQSQKSGFAKAMAKYNATANRIKRGLPLKGKKNAVQDISASPKDREGTGPSEDTSLIRRAGDSGHVIAEP